MNVLLPICSVVLLSVISGILYRIGGTKHGTLWRDLGVPAVMIAAMFVLGHWHWTLVLCFGLLWASLTTYNKWVGYFFNRPDKHTVYWESWLVTGLFYGLAMLPYVIYDGNWIGFLLRTSILALFVCLWSELIGKDWLEEGGRGFAIIATLPLI